MKARIHNFSKYKNLRRKLRNNSTKAEKILWNELRNKKVGYKFRRQQSVGNCVVDFYCPNLKIVIEIDGYIHGEKSKKDKDEIKQKFLEDENFLILRYRNEQVLFDLDSVVQDIKNKCDQVINHP